MATDADAGKHGTTGTAGTGNSGDGASRDEDSGLHDLRSLATRTRSRMTSQRLAVLDSEAEISTSSQALRAVALPEPAKMVALPAPPTAAQLGEAVAAAARAAEVKNAKPARARGTTNEPAMVASAAPTAAQASSGNGKYVIGGIVAIAAAGAVVFAVTRSSNKPAQVAAPVVAVATVPKPAPAAPIAPPPQVAVAAAVAPPAAVDPTPAPVEATHKAEPAVAKSDAPSPTKDKPSKAADAPKADKAVAAKPSGKGDGESLDDLLGAAGEKAGAQKAADAPKPEKKSLTSGDIKSAMGPLTKRAQACQGSTGATGSVAIKVVVSANGKVKSAQATGSFAGSPAGECVAKVARQATFPAWDGAPTITVDYAYFLAE